MEKSKYRKRYDRIMNDFEKAKAEDKKENEKLIKILNDVHYRKEKIDDGNEKVGNKIADKVAQFGGSWTFIITFIIILSVWMFINIVHIAGVNFDPYPFILLNLFLSCIAAIQAPIIMMSQNRQAEHDKIDAENDAKVNKQSNAKLNLAMRRMENLHNEMEHLQRLVQLDIDMKIENESSTDNK